MTRAALARPPRILATALPSGLAVTALAVAALAVTAALGVGLGPASAAAAPKNVGLYGSSAPTYDGVFRQSLAILGLHAAGQTPDPTAVDWLLDQQCADGAFSSYNPTPAKDCPPLTSTFTGGEDTNATSLALQALLVTGHAKQAGAAAKALRAAQDKDGGWPFFVGGGASDPNSTGLVLTALAAAGDGVDADGAAYLSGLQVGCGTSAEPSDAGDRGGIATPYTNGAPDVLGTVQAIPGLSGLSLAATLPPAGTWADGGPTFPCDASPSPSPSVSPSASPSPSPSASASGSVAGPDDVAAWAATWLAGQPKAAEAGNVGWAILSFASTHSHHSTAVALYSHLSAQLAKQTVAKKGFQRALAQSAESPGALGLGALSAQTLGHHSAAVGYGHRIALTITASGASASPSPSATKSADPTASASAAVSASASASGPQLPRTGGEPVLLVGGLLLLVAGGSLVWLGARRRT